MKKFLLPVAFVALLLTACSQEEPAPLPPLKTVAVPEGVVGMYSGNMPCDACKSQIFRAFLTEDSTARIVRSVLNEKVEVDTLSGKFSVNGEKVSLLLSEGKLKFEFLRNKMGNLSLLNGTGAVYEDADGQKFDLVKVYAQQKIKVREEP